MQQNPYALQAIYLYQECTETINSQIVSSQPFIVFCDEHRILSRMEKKILPYLQDKNLRSIFHEKLISNRQRGLMQMSLLLQIAKLFTENQITWLSFKGPILSYELFGDAALRSSKDLDIWVPKQDLFLAKKLLEQLHFKQDPHDLTIKPSKLEQAFKKDIIYHHDLMNIELEPQFPKNCT